MTNKPAQTADERFLIQFYQLADGKADKPVAIAKAARAARLKETAVKTIIKHLAQANLIKKVGDDAVMLTAHGIELAEELLGV